VSTTIRWFKAIALAEAVSYLVLLAASVAKHAADAPGQVSVMGPVHGLVFLAYLGLALYVREELDWNLWTTLMVVVAAVVPFGGFVVERRLPGLDRARTGDAAVSS
jgi:integral membrane protein